MALIEWNESLSVSVAAFDGEHSRLIDLINELHSAMMSGKGREVIRKVLTDLLEYTRYHFTHEEAALEKFDYPALESQRKQHALFVEKLAALTEKQDKGEMFVPVEVLEFLNSWLVNHIKGEDKKYGSFLKGKPV